MTNKKVKLEEQYQSPALPGILGGVNALEERTVLVEQKPRKFLIDSAFICLLSKHTIPQSFGYVGRV